MMKFDLHMHTKRHSPDSVMDPFTLVKRAKEVGLDGIVITEHDWLWTEAELEELRAAAPDLVILAGVEVTARGGDLLCYGIHNPFALPRGATWKDICAEVQAQGGAVVAAHPYRWSQPFDKLLREQQPLLDGVEVMSKNMDDDMRQKVANFRKRHPEMIALGNSDSHEPETVGCCHTIFDAKIRNNTDLVAAIKAGRTTPVEVYTV